MGTLEHQPTLGMSGDTEETKKFISTDLEARFDSFESDVKRSIETIQLELKSLTSNDRNGEDNDSDNRIVPQPIDFIQENCGGFHLHTVISTVNISHSRLQRCSIVVASLSLVIIQILTLLWLIQQESAPRCSMNSDCGFGEYCNQGYGGNIPSCAPCYDLINDIRNKTYTEFCEDSYSDVLNDGVLMWISPNNIWHPKVLFNSTEAVRCLQLLYCVQNNIGNEDDQYQYSPAHDFTTDNTMFYQDGGGQVEFYHKCAIAKMNLNKLDWKGILILTFALMLFVIELLRGIKESISEEELLNSQIKKKYYQRNSSPPQPELLIVWTTIYLRRFVLPWVIVASSVIIIITDSISAKSILLNLVAVAFIAQMNNILPKLLFSLNHEETAKDFMNEVKDDDFLKAQLEQSPLIMFTWWPQVLVLIPVIMMIIVIPNAESLVQMFFPIVTATCDDLNATITTLFTIYSPWVMIFMESIIRFSIIKERDEDTSLGKKFFVSLLHLCLCSNSVLISGCLYFISIGRYVIVVVFLFLLLLNFLSAFGFYQIIYPILRYQTGLVLSVCYIIFISCCVTGAIFSQRSKYFDSLFKF